MRHSRVAVLLIGAVVGHALQAQAVGELRGKVVDQAGRAIENAEVELLPGSLHAITLDDGRFAISNVRVGVYVLSARRIGYEPTDVNVAVSGDSTVTFTITLVTISAQLDAIHIREKAGEIQYSGVVLDQFDVPVAEAEVVAVGINSQLKTDGMGRFTVPKLGKGTLAVRIRKVGYSAYFGSFRILAERADTIRMSRLAASLTPVEINELSGFGRDYWAYREMQQRQTWKNAMNGAISREELAQHGTENLCDALPGTPSGATLSMPMDPWCKLLPKGEKTILVDGVRCVHGLLSDYPAADVEFVEYYSVTTKLVGSKPFGTIAKQRGPLLAADDMSGSLRAHQCDAPPPVYVIWLRHDTLKATPTRVVALDANPAVDSTIQRLPPVEVHAAVPLIDAAHLQGQVVDSANHPLRSALVYTQDPLYATLTDKNGYFKFRELPSGPITVRAERRGYVPIEFQLRLPPDSTVGIGLKLLSAAPAIGTMQLDTTGAQGRVVRVVSDRGQPVMYANVTLEGAQARITDAKGEINLDSGTRQKFSVRVARIGFAPWFGVVDLPANATMTVTLPQIAQLLAPVTVTGGAGGPQNKLSLPLSGFYDRWMMRQKGTVSGVFIGPEEIEFRHPTKVTRMLAGLNGIRLICDMSGDCSVQSTSPGGLLPGTACPLAVVLDGSQIYGQVNVDELINANDVMAIEVYARGGNVPIGLQVNDTKCGVVAFWTGSRRP
jgi:hypothetical protein